MAVVSKLGVLFLTYVLVLGTEAFAGKTNKKILERKHKRKAEKIEQEAAQLNKVAAKLKKQGKDGAVAAVNNYVKCMRKLATAYSDGKLDSVEPLEDKIKVAAVRCLCQGYKAKVRLSWQERKYVRLYKSLIGVAELADDKDSEFKSAMDDYAKFCVEMLGTSDKVKLAKLNKNGRELKKKFYSQRKKFVKYKMQWAKLPIAKKREMMQVAFNNHLTDFADEAPEAKAKPVEEKPEDNPKDKPKEKPKVKPEDQPEVKPKDQPKVKPKDQPKVK